MIASFSRDTDSSCDLSVSVSLEEVTDAFFCAASLSRSIVILVS